MAGFSRTYSDPEALLSSRIRLAEKKNEFGCAVAEFRRTASAAKVNAEVKKAESLNNHLRARLCAIGLTLDDATCAMKEAGR